MSRPRQDLTGQHFGRLTVLREGPRSPAGAIRWVVQCTCGSPEKLLQTQHLTQGQVISCGCRLREIRRERAQRAGRMRQPSTRHRPGLSGERPGRQNH